MKNTINERFLNEAKNLEALWKKQGLLDGILEKYDRTKMATLMCCQRLTNEIAPVEEQVQDDPVVERYTQPS